MNSFFFVVVQGNEKRMFNNISLEFTFRNVSYLGFNYNIVNNTD